jgi:hypothetical protein
VAFTNPGFETANADGRPGEAAGWDYAVVCGARPICAFLYGEDDAGEPIYAPWEGFGVLWGGNEDDVFAFDDGTSEACEFDVTATTTEEDEPFEGLWHPNATFGGKTNDSDVFVLSDGATERATFTYSELPYTAYESFEDALGIVPGDPENYLTTEDWNGSVYKIGFVPADLSAATFDSGIPHAVEDFEEEWDNNQNDILVFTAPDLTWAGFGAGYSTTATVEQFEDVFEEREFSVTPLTDVLTLASAHTLQVNEIVRVRNEAGVLPDPLAASVVYYVLTSATPDITVSTSVGGPVVDIVDEGVGTHYIRADLTWYWQTVLD